MKIPKWFIACWTVAACVALSGCGNLFNPPARLVEAVLQIEMFPGTLTIACDASASRGRNLVYNWDFDDGAVVAGGPPSLTHQYAAPGVYNVRVTVIDTRGRVSRTDTASQIVNLLDTVGDPHAVILVFRHSSGEPASAFYSWEKATFVGSASSDPNGLPMTYWWQIRPVDNDGKPITNDPMWRTNPIVSSEVNFVCMLPGPLCGPPVIVQRVEVKLIVRNELGRTGTAVTYITVTGG